MKRFIILIKTFIYRTAGFLIFVPVSIISSLQLKRFKPDEAKGIIIFSWGGLGNILMLLPFLKAVKKGFKNAKVHVVTMSKLQYEFMLAMLPEIKPLYVPEKENHIISGIRSLRVKFKNKEIDLSFHPYLEHTGRSVWWSKFIGTRIIVGFAPPSIGPWQAVRLKVNKEISEGENYLNMLRAFDIDSPKKTKLIEVNEAIKKRARRLTDEALVTSGKIIGIHCGSLRSQKEKRWGVNRFIELVNMLLGFYEDLGIIIFFGPDEADLYFDFMAVFQDDGRIFLMKESELPLFCGLLEHLSLFVSNDSGPMHLASAMGVPIISIWGPTDPVKNRPWVKDIGIITLGLACSPCYRIGRPIICKERHCLEGITAEMLFNAIVKKL